MIIAEQGDVIEVRLAQGGLMDGTWSLSGHSGDARIEAQGDAVLRHDQTGIIAVFRFRALGIGTGKLVFSFHARGEAPKPQQVVTFNVTIR